MSTLTIRLPDGKRERLKALAKSNSISINRLMDEPATIALANYNARVRHNGRVATILNCSDIKRLQLGDAPVQLRQCRSHLRNGEVCTDGAAWYLLCSHG